MSKILIGSTFPLALIRRPVKIRPALLRELKAAIRNADSVASFWGHGNTIAAANEILGIDVTPRTERPAVILDRKHPSLDGVRYSVVWVLSPDYIPGFRPQIGVEVQPDQIVGWQTLKLMFD